MTAKDLSRVALKAAIALLGGGVFYSLWLAVFLLVQPLHIAAVELAVWLLSPVVTAAGFAAGSLVYTRLAKGRRETFLHALTWPLAACVLGVLAVYWIGPMLIVFAMLWAGTLSVALREILAQRGKRRR